MWLEWRGLKLPDEVTSSVISRNDVKRRSSVTLRAVLLGILLIPMNAYWASNRGGDVIISLLVPPVVTTFALTLINLPLVWRGWRFALSQAELSTIYATLAIATGIASEWGSAPSLAGFHTWFDSPERRYVEEILPHLPKWMIATERDALEHYYLGHVPLALYTPSDILAWLRPALGWCGLIFALTFVMLCLLTLMAPRWLEQEKLSFPIAVVPSRIVERGCAPRLLKNSLFWLGMLFGFLYDGIQGWLFWSYGKLSQPWKGLDLSQLIPARPWNVIGWTPFPLLPFMIATCYFIPTGLAFSCALFYWFRKAQQVLAAALGYDVVPLWGGMVGAAQVPYLTEQSVGALLMLFAVALWNSRYYLLHGIRPIARATQNSKWHELLRNGLVGFAIGWIMLIGYAISMRTSTLFMLFYFVIFIAISTAITKIRAEIGPPIHEFAFMGPNRVIIDAVGAERLGDRVITLMGMLYFTHRIWRSHPMPQMVEGLKLAYDADALDMRFFTAMALAIAFGALAMFWARLQVGYQWGGSMGGFAYTAWIMQWRNMKKPNYVAMMFSLGGATLTLFLVFLYHRYPMLPLHPAAYGLSMNFGIDYCWFPMLIAGFAKGIILRYGGQALYYHFMPLAVGVILGEYVTGTVWSWIYIITHRPTYSFSIN